MLIPGRGSPCQLLKRWNIVVSKETDQGLRQFLADEGRAKKGEISRFVEEAVNKRIFELALKESHERNADVDPEYIEQAIEESLAWARARLR